VINFQREEKDQDALLTKESLSSASKKYILSCLLGFCCNNDYVPTKILKFIMILLSSDQI
jgi:hypothetical protein